MGLSRTLLKHRARIFLLGLGALALGLIGSYLVLQSRLGVRTNVSGVPPGIRLILPGCILLIIGGIVVLGRSITPMKWESRFCLICSKTTRHFRTDPRFKNGKKIGDTYVCEHCGQKYLLSPENSLRNTNTPTSETSR